MTWPELLAVQLQQGITDGLVVLTRHLILRRTKDKHLPNLRPSTHHYIHTNLEEQTQIEYNLLRSQTVTAADNKNDNVLSSQKNNFLQRITALQLLCAHPQMAEETIKSIEGVSTRRKSKSHQPPQQSIPAGNSKINVIYVQPEDTNKAPKIGRLISLLKDLWKPNVQPKSVIFSEWTVFLDW
jgi:SNF2 family DNA or RNA helicase